MVKADVKRDYYADLELSKDADIVEIKKQFKKLALKYHPDRNPGHEEEFNAKFQAIQLAHEVLSDPTQKAKYDADRTRLSGYGYEGFSSKPNVPPRNPYAAYSNFPPPPKPPPPRSSTASAYASYTSAGADRYSAFARSTYARRSREEPHARTNAYKAWENMNKSSNNAKQAPNPAPFPPPPRSTDGAPKTPSSKAASGWNGYSEPKNSPPTVNRTQSARVPRKTGFAPATPGGDEPPAPSSYSHFSGNRNGRADTFQADGSTGDSIPARQPPSVRNKSDPLSQFQELNESINGLETPRLRTPYAVTGGEKTYFSASTTKRSSTLQDSTRPPPSVRHRSVSPLGNWNPDSLKTESRTNPPTPNESPPKRTTSPANVPPRPNRRVQSHSRRDRFDHYVPSDTSSDEQKESGYESPTFMERLAAEGRARGRRRGRPRHYAYPAYESPSGQKTGVSAGPSGGPPRDSRPEHTETSTKGPPMVGARKASAANSSDKEGKQSTTFTFSVDDSMFDTIPPATKNARSSSTDNINTHFSPVNWHGEFKSNTNDYSQPPPIRRKPVRSQSPIKTTFQDQPKPDNVPGSHSNQDSTSPVGPAWEPFRSDYWTEELKQHSWEPPPTPQASPKRSAPMSRRLSESRSKSLKGINGIRSTRRATAPQPATVSTDSERSDGQESPPQSMPTATKAEETSPGEGNSVGSAMDVDSPMPPKERQEHSAPIMSNGTSGTDPNGTAHPGIVEPGTKQSTSNRASSPPGDSKPESDEASSSSKINLDNLINVAPFTQNTGQGLQDMQDLSSTLPFESRASTINHLTPLAPRRLLPPNPPKAPPAPNQLTQSTWEQYLANMRKYMYQWNAFMDDMLAHFQERQVETKERLTPNWMGILGEGPKGGYLKYMQGVEEDFRVREHWDVAWEKHRDAMWSFGKVRARAVEKALRSA